MWKKAALVALILGLMALSFFARDIFSGPLRLPALLRMEAPVPDLPLPERIRQQAFDNCMRQLAALRIMRVAHTSSTTLGSTQSDTLAPWAAQECVRLYSFCHKARQAAAVMPTRTPDPQTLPSWHK